MLRMIRQLCSMLLVLTYMLPASAQNQYSLSDLEAGQLILNLNVSEDTEVEQDRLTVVLQYTAQGRDKAALQNEVNAAVRNALELLSGAEALEYSTQQYHVYIFEPGRPARSDINNPQWRAQQSVELVSKDSGELLELAGELQTAGLHITSMYYSVDPDTYESVADTLMTAALLKLQARAEEAATTLGKSRAELIEVSVDGNRNFGFRPEFRQMAMATDAVVDSPVAEPGRSQITVTVSARALLSP